MKPKRDKFGRFIKGQHYSPETEFKKGDPEISGENSNAWKGGVFNNFGRLEWQRRWRRKNREILLKKRRERRHRTGRNKKWRYKSLGLEPPPMTYYRRVSNFRRRKKFGGQKVQIIQRVYEDNIKQYGTLTCFYCLKPIPFGKDCIDHKLPLCKGGNHNYGNLVVACRSCNNRKNTKTAKEFLKIIKTSGEQQGGGS